MTWRDTELVPATLECVNVQEARGFDFEKLMTYPNKDGTVFIAIKPRDEPEPIAPETEECCRWC